LLFPDGLFEDLGHVVQHGVKSLVYPRTKYLPDQVIGTAHDSFQDDESSMYSFNVDAFHRSSSKNCLASKKNMMLM
jgi:hypothetical protein